MVEIGTRVYRLTFEDWPGAYIRAEGRSLGTLLELGETIAGTDVSGGVDKDVLTKVYGEGLRPFLDAVVEWNLEVRNPVTGELEPVPITAEGVLSLPDPGLILDAVEQWRDAQMRVKPPLPQPSASGGSSVEGSIPMMGVP